MTLLPNVLRVACAALALAPIACALPPAGDGSSWQAALPNYPPLVMGANVRPADGSLPRACPAGGRVETKGGPAFDYLGASPANPDLCRMRVGGQAVEAWFGIWVTDWPGAAEAYPLLRQVIAGRTGDVVGLDVRAAPGAQWHDLMRNEGIESINLLGTTYQAMKISHYREGFGGNTYRSLATVWKDMASGMLVYGTYQHISGRPELDDPLIPTAIRPLP